MRTRPSLLLAMAALAVASAGALTSAAAGAGTGTFTLITTPAGASTTIRFNAPPTPTTLTVTGQTSFDVTTVDIDCVFMATSGPVVSHLASSVPVSGGTFSTVATVPNLSANCRLRAVPQGVDPASDYLGAYAGPILYLWEVVPTKDGSTTIGYQAATERGDGVAVATDAASCGPDLFATIVPPAMTVFGLAREACTMALPGGNVTTSGTSTASSIVVSGHNAYLPDTVRTYLRGTLGLTIAQPALAISTSRAGNGDLTITETAALMRCASDLYPPTSGSCTSLVATGVTFTRVTSLIRGSHQTRVRDTFTSTDGQSHAVSVEYMSQAEPASAGAPGLLFPGNAHFSTMVPDQVVTGLGTTAATVLIRSDIHAVDGEQAADTRALTWSRAPSKVQFSHDWPSGQLAMPYALTVPSGGHAYLGFTLSGENRTTQVQPLATLAAAEMMRAPTITSPTNHAHLHGHLITVKGTVARGANGLPKSVSVNGHLARLTSVSPDRATYRAMFTLAFGTHRITATATDSANNRRTRSITIRNTA